MVSFHFVGTKRSNVHLYEPVKDFSKGDSRSSITEHHVTRFCPSRFTHMLRTLLQFRNRHSCTAAYVQMPGSTAVEGSPWASAGEIRCPPESWSNSHVLHWPAQCDERWCTREADGSVLVTNMDGYGLLRMSPHRQLVQLAYPVVVAGTASSPVLIHRPIVWIHSLP